MIDHQQKERLLKVVLCGDGASGKTSLCLRFAHESFNADYHQTLGLDFFTRRVILPGEIGVTLQVWDVGGQSIASSMISKYISGADAIIIVYDITNKTSFEGAREWTESVKKMIKQSELLPVLALVGNKTDLEAKRQVKMEAHNRYAVDQEMTSMYTSARTGDSVTLLFKQMAAQVMKIPMAKSELDKEVVPIMAEATATSQDAPKRGSSRVAGQNNTTVCAMM